MLQHLNSGNCTLCHKKPRLKAARIIRLNHAGGHESPVFAAGCIIPTNHNGALL